MYGKQRGQECFDVVMFITLSMVDVLGRCERRAVVMILGAEAETRLAKQPLFRSRDWILIGSGARFPTATSTVASIHFTGSLYVV